LLKKNYLFIILSLTMNFLNDKASKLMLQVLLVIVLLHLGIKRYIQSFGSIRMYDLGSNSLGNVKTVSNSVDVESEPEPESESESESDDDEVEETDVEETDVEETDIETDYETDGEDELMDYVSQKKNVEIKGMGFINEYKNADFQDERLDVASFVKLPKTQGEVTYDLEVPTGKEAEKIIADESVMNGGQLMDGIFGYDNMDSQFASL